MELALGVENASATRAALQNGDGAMRDEGWAIGMFWKAARCTSRTKPELQGGKKAKGEVLGMTGHACDSCRERQ